MPQSGAGYLHPRCAVDSLDQADLVDVLRANSKGLDQADLNELAEQAAGPTTGGVPGA